MALRRYPYLHFDVFTGQRFGGNQLAIFPDAVGLPARTMQLIAKEMNFAETTFVTPATSPDTDVRMRIFTPELEMPMAGHPVIGSTFALARGGRIPRRASSWTYGLNIGPLPVDLEWNGERLAFAWMTQRTPEFGGAEDVAAVARAIGLPEDVIRATGLPVQRVSCGVPFVMVPISTRAAVDSAEPDTRALHALARTSGVEHFSLYVFTTDRSGATDEATAYARMFAPGLGVYEDPATGSACGPLGSYLVRHSIVTASEAGGILILQGRKLGRPSWIHVSIESTGGAISRVRVGGTAVFVAEGLFELEAASLEEVPA